MRKLAGVTAFSLAVLAGSVQAVSLGDIELRSALNQALDAEIGLVKMRPGEASGMRVSLAPMDAFVRAGIDRSSALETLDFQIKQRANGERYVHIASETPITEPFLNFLVELDWPQGSVLREYTVLLDPPVFLSDRSESAPITRTPSSQKSNDEPYVPQAIERSSNTLSNDAGELNLDALIAENAQKPAVAGKSAEPERGRAAVNSLIEGSRGGLEPLPVVAGKDQPLYFLDGKPVYEPLDNLNAGAPPVMVAANDVVEKLPNQKATVSDAGSGNVYTVSGSQTLWSIAKEVKPQGVSIQQTLMAIWRSNQDAFVNGNMNVMRRGAILRIPDAATIRRLNSNEAAQIVKRESSAWRQYQGNAQGQPAKPATANQRETGPKTSNTIKTAEQEQGLKIVAVDDKAQTGDGTASVDSSAADGKSSELRKQLTLVREELESAKLNNAELSDRVRDLEGIKSELERLLEMRNSQLATLQQQMGQAAETPPDNPGESLTEQTLQTLDNGIEATKDAVTDAGEAISEGAQNLLDGNNEDTSSADVTETPLNTVDGDEEAFDPFAETQEVQQPWWEQWLANPLFLPIVGGGLLLLLLLLYLVGRRRKNEDEDERDVFSTLDKSAFSDLDNDGTVAAAATGAGFGNLDDTAQTRANQTYDDDLDATVIASAKDVDDYTQGLDEYTQVVDDADDSANATQMAAGALGEDDRLDLSSEFEMVPGDTDEIQDDTVSEADVYLSYGLLDRAEELLDDAIKREPENASYRVKLLETHHAKGDKEKFAHNAQAYYDNFGGGNSPEWEKVQGWGRAIVPEYTLFGGEADVAHLNKSPAPVSRSPMDADEEEIELDATQILDASLMSDDDLLMDTSINDLTADLEKGKEPPSSSKLATAVAAAGGIAAAGAAAASGAGDKMGEAWDELNATLSDQGDEQALEADLEQTLAGLEQELNLDEDPNDGTSAIDHIGDDTADLLASLRKDEEEFDQDLQLANDAVKADDDTLGFDDSFLADFKEEESAGKAEAETPAAAEDTFLDDALDFTSTNLDDFKETAGDAGAQAAQSGEETLDFLGEAKDSALDDLTADFDQLSAGAEKASAEEDSDVTGLFDTVADKASDVSDAVRDKAEAVTQSVSDAATEVKDNVAESIDGLTASDDESALDFTQHLLDAEGSLDSTVDQVTAETEAGLDELDSALFGDDAGPSATDDDDMQNSLADLERTLAEFDAGEDSAQNTATALAADAAEDSLDQTMLDDLGTIEMELEQSLLDPAVAAEKMHASETLDATQIADDGLALDSTIDAGDEIETMLDLAQAYVEMGDNDSATSALNEIISNGSNQQRAKAQELLAQIS